MLPPNLNTRVPGNQTERLFDSLQRFRHAWPRYHRPDDLRHLLSLFPHVSLEQGYELDYLPMGGTPTVWIWPYARRAGGSEEGPPAVLSGVDRDRLSGLRRSDASRRMEVESLYRRLSFDRSPIGLFEYAFFINELWATKSASKASDWLDMEPIFTRRRFDEVLRRSGTHPLSVKRPDVYDPSAQLKGGASGEVDFMALQGHAWKRIVSMRIAVENDGLCLTKVGPLIANLG